MKIAQIAPLYESVPPKFYGGTERVVYYLTEELVRQGHEVTLFASGDSVTKGKLIPSWQRSLRLSKDIVDHIIPHILQMEKVFQRSAEFDVIHSHMDYLTFPLMRMYPKVPAVTTLHGRLDMKEVIALYREFSDIPLISISDAQREHISWANWRGTVYHGLPPDLYTYRGEAGKYLAFIGRFSPEKRADVAIEIAVRAGMPLKIAAKVDKDDVAYFESVIKPLLKHPLVEYIGEIGEKEKDEFLGCAHALLFPINWPEPFGLVMIEAMACGTPVIACANGSVPEVMEEGVTGFIIGNTAEAVEALKKVSALSRKRCRQVFEERFTVERMASDYVKIYRELIEEKTKRINLLGSRVIQKKR